MKLIITGIVVALFGLATLFMSTSIFFDLFGIREKEGNYVLFVVIANFVCALLYLAGAYGFFKRKRWTTMLMVITAAVLIVTFIALGVYIFSGGIYEKKTVGAMAFRTLLTIGFAYIAYKNIPGKINSKTNHSN